ncbi:MAG: hypothetical protein GYA24_02545 [Candidatus Lokiarchaeota archaeon]|nr:hypothetical protein [Candidatus Lokiarchaeota archaeon]
MRESITYPLKATLVVLTMVAAIAGIIVLVQSSSLMNPAYFDTDNDGFHDLGEIGWSTDRLDPNDNPFTTRVLPVVLAAVGIAIILAIGKVRREHDVSSEARALRGLVEAMKAAVASKDEERVNACKQGFDKCILDIRSSANRDALGEPSIQELLVEFELLGIDALVDKERAALARDPAVQGPEGHV